MDILTRTKLKLMTHPQLTFYSVLAMQMEHVIDDSVPTAANHAGLRVMYNPEFLEKQTTDQILGLMVHELLHTVYMHMFRRQDRDPCLWNIAADYAINWEIVTDMKLQLPEGGCLDAQYAGMTAEQIYDLLMANQPELPDVPQDLVESSGDAPDSLEGEATHISAQARQASQKAVEQAILSAALLTQGVDPGSVPRAIQIFLKDRIKPRIPWNQVLRQYLSPLVRSRYSMAKPNKRFLPVHVPRLMPEEKQLDIAVAWDMSGSLTDTQSCRFLAETLAITKSFKADLTFLQFDTQIQYEGAIRSPRDFNSLEYTGRGGTHLQCLVDWAAKNKPKALLVFTDGHFRIPPKFCCPVIWLIIDNPRFDCPYGKIVHLEKSKS